MADFIPTNADAFYDFVKNLMSVLGKHKTRWSHIPKDAQEELEKWVMNFMTTHNETPLDRTKAQTQARNDAQKICEKKLRNFIKFYLRNPVITNDELKELGIPLIDTTRTPHTVVKEKVDFVVKLRAENELLVDFWQKKSTSKAKPRGYDGAVIVWHIGDKEPDSLQGYEYHTMASRTPYALKFETHDSGKRIWIRIAWQNARGILGDYCEAKSAIVP